MYTRRWQFKSSMQRLFSAMPNGEWVNEQFQRHVTHGLPIGTATIQEHIDAAKHHAHIAMTYGKTDIAHGNFFEFGAGQDFVTALALQHLGVSQQTVVDVKRLARLDLLLSVADRLGDRLGEPRRIDNRDDLQRFLQAAGITYRAPFAAKATGFDAGTVDCITSTNTLEHIPVDDITAIYKERHRILDDDSVMSFQIDYQDHYAQFDDRINVYNFLSFNEHQWKKHDSSLHFQNRLRHDEHIALIFDAGFEVLNCQLTGPDMDDLPSLNSVQLDKAFSAIEPMRLGIRSARIAIHKCAPPVFETQQ